MERTIYREIRATPQLWQVAVLLAGFAAAALVSVAYVEHHGHIVTGMTNHVVWGLPHVFAIFLIVAASGALNVASMASVFGRAQYKPLARLSGVLAIALLAGGLAVLVLDLGRPDRLLVAMTTYNFKSIFAWNVILYTGFIAIVGVYLFTQMSRGGPAQFVKPMGMLAFLWRLALTTGTGSIFGWLVARPGYDAAIMAPLFIAMSFALGLAVFMLVLTALCALGNRPLGARLMQAQARLLGVFAAAVLYFTAVQHLTALYAAEHAGIEAFILRDGGLYTWLFWLGQVALGGLLPMLLIWHPSTAGAPSTPVAAAVLVVLGGLAQIYVIVIGGQAYPMPVFPGYDATSTLADGAIASYAPRWPEVLLGLGGVAIALLATGIGAKVLRILPTNLSDANLNPQG
jgi:molybdopterin-containing oxidoreductase family membrane subunit